MRKLEDLKEASYNARTIEPDNFKGLVHSLSRFGLVAPIIVNSRTGLIVGGHQRFRALKEMGTTEAQVVLVDLDEKDEKLLNITLNNPHVEGEWTEDVFDLLDELRVDEEGTPNDLFDHLKFDELEKELAEKFKDRIKAPMDRPFPRIGALMMDGTTQEWGDRRKNWSDVGYPGLTDSKRVGDMPVGIGALDPCLTEWLFKSLPQGIVVHDIFGGNVGKNLICSWLAHPYRGYDLHQDVVSGNQQAMKAHEFTATSSWEVFEAIVAASKASGHVLVDLPTQGMHYSSDSSDFSNLSPKMYRTKVEMLIRQINDNDDIASVDFIINDAYCIDNGYNDIAAFIESKMERPLKDKKLLIVPSGNFPIIVRQLSAQQRLIKNHITILRY